MSVIAVVAAAAAAAVVVVVVVVAYNTEKYQTMSAYQQFMT